MRHLALLALLFTPGCSRWAYGPTWRAVDASDQVALQYEGNVTCGTLSVANGTPKPIAVAWSDVHVLLPWGERRETAPYVADGAQPPDDARRIDAGERVEQALCLDLRLFEVHPRPVTVWDVTMGWMLGAGVLAGNVAWEPDDHKRNAVIPDPEVYGWELVVPVTGDGQRRDLTMRVKGDGVTAFKYTPWAHGEPDPLEQLRGVR